jgi:putative FmdB family regulatory protein
MAQRPAFSATEAFMPAYDYLCEACGPFTEIRPMAESDAPCDCPECGGSAPRALLRAPYFSCVSANDRIAHSTNERARHEPMSLDQFKNKRHRAGCACCGPKKPSRLVTESKTGERGFPTARPWMISH